MSDNSDYNPDDNNFFGFTPSLAAGVTFVTVFSLLTIAHFAFTIISRRWWAITTVVGGVGEILGWIGRLAGHFKTTGLSYYLLQQVLLALSPTFFSATCYVIFGRITVLLGTEYSRLTPRMYWIVFVIVDIVSLTLQGTGGGMSGSSAAGSGASLSTGRNIYLAGISFQLANMLVFCYLVAEYFWRLRKAGKLHWEQIGGAAMKRLLVGLWGASILIIFRNFYREFELGEGFDGYLSVQEAYFDCLDAVPMVFCMVFLAIAHPLFTFDKLTGRLPINAPFADMQAEQEKLREPKV